MINIDKISLKNLQIEAIKKNLRGDPHIMVEKKYRSAIFRHRKVVKNFLFFLKVAQGVQGCILGGRQRPGIGWFGCPRTKVQHIDTSILSTFTMMSYVDESEFELEIWKIGGITYIQSVMSTFPLYQNRYSIPIRTKSFGYHSATECRSYDRPKIRQKPTL